MRAWSFAQSAVGSTVSGAAWQFHDAGSEDRHFIVLVVGFLLDLDQMTPALDELAFHLALDEQHIAFGIMPADLAGRTTQEAIIAHPVSEMMGQPRAAFRTVVVGAGRADFAREFLFPVHALGTIGNAEAVRDTEAAMGGLQLPCELVGPGI